jgi:hypothetical protein
MATLTISNLPPNPDSGTPSDPNAMLQQDTEKLFSDQQQMAADYAAIGAALTNMETAMKSGNTQEIFMALQVALYQIMPDIESYQGDNIQQLSDAQNISSDLRTFGTDGQNAFNDTSGNSAAALFDNTQDLIGGDANNNGSNYNFNVTVTVTNSSGQVVVNDQSESWIQLLDGDTTGGLANVWGSNTTALDTNDAATILGSLQSIETQFGGTNGSGGSWGNTSEMATTIAGWYNQSNTDPAMPQAQIKTIQGAYQQITQSVSTLATSIQTNEQFYTQQFNQVLGIDNNMLQSQNQQVTTLVQNEISS